MCHNRLTVICHISVPGNGDKFMQHATVYKITRYFINLFLVLAIFPVHAVPPENVSTVNFSPLPTAVIIEYTLEHDMLVQQDTQPLIRIYGDGKVLVHYPVYMKKAGDYEMQLTRNELQLLLRQIVQDGILEYKAADVHQAMRVHDKARADLYQESDISYSKININLQSYIDGKKLQLIPVLATSVRVGNLVSQARRYANISALQGVAQTEKRLHTLLDHNKLRAR